METRKNNTNVDEKIKKGYTFEIGLAIDKSFETYKKPF